MQGLLVRWVACGCVLSMCAVASAQVTPRTAIVPFDGMRPGGLQRRVTKVLRDRTPLVETAEVREAASSAGVSGTEENGVAELAAQVEAELVVQGTVGPPGRSLEMVVRTPDGSELVRGRATYGRGGRGRREFDNEVGEIFDRALAERSRRGPSERRASPATPEPVAPAPAPEEPAFVAAPADGLAILAPVIGIAVRNREASVDLNTGGTAGYQLDAYPELRIALEARPFANDTHLGRGLFLQAGFGHSLGLGSRVVSGPCMADPTQPGCSVSTNFVRFSIGAGWMAPIEEIVELGGGFTVGYDGYHFGANAAFTTAEYVYLRPGVRARLRIFQEALVLDTEIAYRGVVGMGAIAATFGENASAHGIDLAVGVGGNLFVLYDLGFTWAVRVDWTRYFLSFAGPSDGPPADSGSDSSFGVSFLVGWSIR